jgi:hypothetical protein
MKARITATTNKSLLKTYKFRIVCFHNFKAYNYMHYAVDSTTTQQQQKSLNITQIKSFKCLTF